MARIQGLCALNSAFVTGWPVVVFRRARPRRNVRATRYGCWMRDDRTAAATPVDHHDGFASPAGIAGRVLTSTAPRYLSLFSGVGGLEHPEVAPVIACEVDPHCRTVLASQYPDTELWPDVQTLQPPAADMVVGGWPCQDISSAGRLGGLAGARSGLFFEMLRVAVSSGAETLVGENVPNLLNINKGKEFDSVLKALTEAGYPFIAWRILNARSFGLPQARRRLFIVASKAPERAEALHASIPPLPQNLPPDAGYAAGFYWTAGKRSICFSPGYVPALKIGATDEKGRSPVAVFVNGRVRKLSVSENLRLQGLEHIESPDLKPSALLRMAGNAVPAPVGRFVVKSVSDCAPAEGIRTSFGTIGSAGFAEDGLPWTIEHEPTALATNLIDFLDLNDQNSLTPQAAAGLLVRSTRSGLPLPLELFETLVALTQDRTQRLHPSRADSFAALDSMQDDLKRYARKLSPVNESFDSSSVGGAPSALRRIV